MGFWGLLTGLAAAKYIVSDNGNDGGGIQYVYTPAQIAEMEERAAIRQAKWEDANAEDINYLRAYVYKWLLRYAEDPEQIYSGYTPDKLLDLKELPYLPGFSATALHQIGSSAASSIIQQQIRSSVSFIIQNRSALGEYFTEDEIAGTARFLDKLSHIYSIGTK